MTRSALRSFTNTKAHQVVAHAIRQRRRGKRPALQYKHLRNPMKALELALAELSAGKTRRGETIEAAIERMLLVAQATFREQELTYGGVTVAIRPHSRRGQVLREYTYRSNVVADMNKARPIGS